MNNIKTFVMGMIVMALIASVAFNVYQLGQLGQCAIMPNNMKGMDLNDK